MCAAESDLCAPLSLLQQGKGSLHLRKRERPAEMVVWLADASARDFLVGMVLQVGIPILLSSVETSAEHAARQHPVRFEN